MRRLCLLPALFLVLACGSNDGSEAFGGGTSLPSAPETVAANEKEQTAPEEKPALTTLSGKYELSTRYDLTTAGVFPDVANGSLRALSQLKDNPSKTIIDLLKAAHVPIIATVLALLPDQIEAPFENWFNDAFFDTVYQNMPASKRIADLVDDLASLATKFEVTSSLNLPTPNENGESGASHALTGLGFTILGQRTIFHAPASLAPETHADHVPATLLHILEHSPKVENGLLELGDHGFSVPLGDYLVQAADKLAEAKFGAPTFAEALEKAFDCAGIAHKVSDRCLGPVCVGHETQIKEMCIAGVDLVAHQVLDNLRAIKIDFLRLANGQAAMWDAPKPDGVMDGKIDRLDKGRWTAFMRTSLVEHSVTATFTGTRVADADDAPAQPAAVK